MAKKKAPLLSMLTNTFFFRGGKTLTIQPQHFVGNMLESRHRVLYVSPFYGIIPGGSTR